MISFYIGTSVLALLYWHFYIGTSQQVGIIVVLKKSKGLPQQAEVTQGVPGRLRPQIS